MGVNSVNGNFEFGFNSNRISSPIRTGNIDTPILSFQKTDSTDRVNISRTPGNTGVSESTARGTLEFLDELAKYY